MAQVKKILVANRAEIACRVFQTAREMGLQTAAIFVDGDEEARHVTYADEVFEVPSYLDVEAIVRVAKEAGVHLIHPGYGFLSERPKFVEAVEKAGIVFLGPTAKTMKLMGEKIAAKEVAEKQKVPTLPWSRVSSLEDLKKASKKIGFPLLLKAAAGGGGKGMRQVFSEKELEAASESAKAEALAAFGDDTLFVEKLVEKPRHIEVQVFGDGKGKGVHFFERDCSLQRRHQKVWEEAPAPRLSEKGRKKLTDAALRLIEAIEYRSAGTLEFLVDEKENFYFLEMNTRLQVEHPVTEMVTGLDLVREQILLGMNSKYTLPEVSEPRGHAIEVRIYAEDPAQDYMPTPGLIGALRWPTGPGIRIDSGVEEGQKISTQFDPMIAKITVWGVDRPHAISRLKFALEETVIQGLGTNQAFLRALCDQPVVETAHWDTKFLEREFSSWKPEASEEVLEWVSYSKNRSPKAHQDKGSLPSPWTHFGGQG